MAAIAYAAVVVTGAGIVVGILTWVTHKEELPYAAAQALQAAVCQLLGAIAVTVLWAAYSVFVFGAMLPLMQNPTQYKDTLPPQLGGYARPA